MSNSKAKKTRIKLHQQGKRNPELSRLSWNGVNPATKCTPTLAESKQKQHRKHKWNQSQQHCDDSIYSFQTAFIWSLTA